MRIYNHHIKGMGDAVTVVIEDPDMWFDLTDISTMDGDGKAIEMKYVSTSIDGEVVHHRDDGGRIFRCFPGFNTRVNGPVVV